jgi:hypothetical protein
VNDFLVRQHDIPSFEELSTLITTCVFDLKMIFEMVSNSFLYIKAPIADVAEEPQNFMVDLLLMTENMR